MKKLGLCLLLPALVVVGTMAGCSAPSTKSAEVSRGIRTSLDQAGLKDVSVSQDRDKGVVTLGGQVADESEKTQAATLAKDIAGTQVVSNQIAVIPPGGESDAKKVNFALDEGIESNLDAAFIKEKLPKTVKYAVKNHVVTLSGEVGSPASRARAEMVASAVPNVEQVVNELQMKKQKASSSN